MDQINPDFIAEYIRSITPDNPAYLKELEAYAEENKIPIIEKEVAQLIKLLLKIKRPRNILELGTAIGYSSLVMAEASREARITTIERWPKMIEKAQDNIKKTNHRDRIEIIEGEAGEVLASLDGKYDFIFLDAAKGQYMEFFNYCQNLLEVGGIIVSDNVLFKGMVASDDLVIRRKKTIVRRLREYLQYINQVEGYISAVIPIGDGVALSYREE